jgi:hypothetical protein
VVEVVVVVLEAEVSFEVEDGLEVSFGVGFEVEVGADIEVDVEVEVASEDFASPRNKIAGSARGTKYAAFRGISGVR